MASIHAPLDQFDKKPRWEDGASLPMGSLSAALSIRWFPIVIPLNEIRQQSYYRPTCAGLTSRTNASLILSTCGRLRDRRGRPHRPPAQPRNNRRPVSLPRLSRRPLSRLGKHCYWPWPALAEHGRACWAAIGKKGQSTDTRPKSMRPRSIRRPWALIIERRQATRRRARKAARPPPPLSTPPSVRRFQRRWRLPVGPHTKWHRQSRVPWVSALGKTRTAAARRRPYSPVRGCARLLSRGRQGSS